MLVLYTFFYGGAIIFKELLTNDRIREREVRLIDEKGTQIGIVSIFEASRMAEERNLDLVQMASNAKPVVCKLMDYGRYRYENLKKEKEAQKKQKVIEIKDIWLSQTIDIGDINTKSKATRKFLEQGNKVRVSIRMKGRQQAHPEVSMKVMEQFFEIVKDVAQIEKEATREGRNVAMILAPTKNN